MAKDPAFLFYPSDWDGGTKLFTRAQKGAYMDLLMCQFHSGHMTSHDVAHVLGQNDFDAMWESKLKAKFQQDEDGNFFNQRLEDEQLRRKKWCASRNNNKQGSNQYNGHMTVHTGGHMVNRDENGIANATKTTKRTTKTTSLNNDEFEILWQLYPNKLGKKASLRHYNATVITPEDRESIHKALDNFIEYCKDKEPKFIQHGSTWFNNWHDWVDYKEPETEQTKLTHEQEIMRKVGIRC